MEDVQLTGLIATVVAHVLWRQHIPSALLDGIQADMMRLTDTVVDMIFPCGTKPSFDILFWYQLYCVCLRSVSVIPALWSAAFPERRSDSQTQLAQCSRSARGRSEAFWCLRAWSCSCDFNIISCLQKLQRVAAVGFWSVKALRNWVPFRYFWQKLCRTLTFWYMRPFPASSIGRTIPCA